MAYRRTRVAKKKRSGGTRRRRYPTKKRTYKRPSRRMPRKAILNLTSKKKHDRMLLYSNVTAANPVGSGTYTNSPAILTGDRVYFFPWIATARDGAQRMNAGQPVEAGPIDYAARTATTCFMRGLKERISIQTNDGLPWLWRRLCFAVKDRTMPTTTTTFSTHAYVSSGVPRIINQPVVGSAFDRLIWKGQFGTDWINFMTAEVDTSRVDLRYDKTMNLSSGNEQGMIREFNRWHPMNKNLTYDDDEIGNDVDTSFLSTTAKSGMGDFWVVDIFEPRVGGTTASQLRFRPEATLYWHER